MRTKSFLATVSALLLTAMLLAGCNTVSGVGQDVQAGGRAVTNAAESAK